MAAERIEVRGRLLNIYPTSDCNCLFCREAPGKFFCCVADSGRDATMLADGRWFSGTLHPHSLFLSRDALLAVLLNNPNPIPE
jgi:hypothetical protein